MLLTAIIPVVIDSGSGTVLVMPKEIHLLILYIKYLFYYCKNSAFQVMDQTELCLCSLVSHELYIDPWLAVLGVCHYRVWCVTTVSGVSLSCLVCHYRVWCATTVSGVPLPCLVCHYRV